ncbi:unnamed protein product [Ambrosiozyma monospora]|uniref:Unnamed protein product n=1 Tax=Ambrosiozyma monospora TaxID=43982 RepID=A0A9W6YWL9_AMBMO|nr:unnamed protein product [Ambrosiozyma monospora]
MSTPSNLERPSTPLHPEANQEIEISNNEPLPDDLKSALDMGNDSDDDDDSDMLVANSINSQPQQPHQLHTRQQSISGPTRTEYSLDAELDDGLDDDLDEDEDILLSDEDEDDDSMIPERERLQKQWQNPQKSALSPVSTNITSPSSGSTTTEGQTPIVGTMTPAIGNFYDFNTQRRELLNPFSANANVTSSNPIRIMRHHQTQQQQQHSQQVPQVLFRRSSDGAGLDRTLSGVQQTRLMNHIDDKLMEIQRKFIRFLSLRSDDETEQLPNYISDPINGDPLPLTTTTTASSEMTEQSEDKTENTNKDNAERKTGNSETTQLNQSKEDCFTLEQMISQLDSLIKLIYFSIFKQTTIPRIYHDNIPSKLSLLKETQTNFNTYEPPQPPQLQLQLPQQQNSMLGQLTSYVIKIMGDLIDYLSKYPIRSLNSWLSVLNLLSDLDNFVCLLIDIDSDDLEDDEDDAEGKYGGGFGDASMSLDGGAVESEVGNGSSKKWHIVNDTDKIRIESIVNRTKILLMKKFDLFQDSILKRSSEIEDLLTLFEFYLGAVYEGIYDRTLI